MMMRQGAGRLIRNDQDKGIIAILDPRIRTKNYGEAILENLPSGMRTYTDIYDAIAGVGIQPNHGLAERDQVVPAASGAGGNRREGVHALLATATRRRDFRAGVAPSPFCAASSRSGAIAEVRSVDH